MTGSMILYAITAIGLAAIVGWAEISWPVRRAIATLGAPGVFLVRLLECPVCFGFWTGVVAGPLFNPIDLPVLSMGPVMHALITGIFTAGTNLILGRLGGLGFPAASSTENP